MNLPDIPQGSNVVGVGIDQIEVSRIRESMERHGESFLSKVFSEQERKICLGPTEHHRPRFLRNILKEPNTQQSNTFEQSRLSLA